MMSNSVSLRSIVLPHPQTQIAANKSLALLKYPEDIAIVHSSSHREFADKVDICKIKANDAKPVGKKW